MDTGSVQDIQPNQLAVLTGQSPDKLKVGHVFQCAGGEYRVEELSRDHAKIFRVSSLRKADTRETPTNFTEDDFDVRDFFGDPQAENTEKGEGGYPPFVVPKTGPFTGNPKPEEGGVNPQEMMERHDIFDKEEQATHPEKYLNRPVTPVDKSGDDSVLGSLAVHSFVRHRDGHWEVVSKKGKVLYKGPTKEKANERLRQIEFFKHKNGAVQNSFDSATKELQNIANELSSLTGNRLITLYRTTGIAESSFDIVNLESILQEIKSSADEVLNQVSVLRKEFLKERGIGGDV